MRGMNNKITPRMHMRCMEREKQEINYDQLAKAIAKAIIEEEREEREQYSLTREWMKFILYPFFFTVSIIMACITVFSFYKAIKIAPALGNSLSESVQFIGYFMLSLISFTLGLTTFYTNKELEKEKDRQFVATVFSNITALVALIVALIALFHEI